ncbi:hypothetical protein BLNAU_11550 [Blattamonas nauphoetae]|uniref:Uncharacterized protein n=1 Tax=Blattamonas nauphoetae TaxID=2049346 RepID=A0ABQ9XQP4_9EUKA|nr:hypothetical protein BLNAU_11550 [Blattamonas nauphoetae]
MTEEPTTLHWKPCPFFPQLKWKSLQLSQIQAIIGPSIDIFNTGGQSIHPGCEYDLIRQFIDTQLKLAYSHHFLQMYVPDGQDVPTHILFNTSLVYQPTSKVMYFLLRRDDDDEWTFLEFVPVDHLNDVLQKQKISLLSHFPEQFHFASSDLPTIFPNSFPLQLFIRDPKRVLKYAIFQHTAAEEVLKRFKESFRNSKSRINGRPSELVPFMMVTDTTKYPQQPDPPTPEYIQALKEARKYPTFHFDFGYMAPLHFTSNQLRCADSSLSIILNKNALDGAGQPQSGDPSLPQPPGSSQDLEVRSILPIEQAFLMSMSVRRVDAQWMIQGYKQRVFDLASRFQRIKNDMAQKQQEETKTETSSEQAAPTAQNAPSPNPTPTVMTPASLPHPSGAPSPRMPESVLSLPSSTSIPQTPILSSTASGQSTPPSVNVQLSPIARPSPAETAAQQIPEATPTAIPPERTEPAQSPVVQEQAIQPEPTQTDPVKEEPSAKETADGAADSTPLEKGLKDEDQPNFGRTMSMYKRFHYRLKVIDEEYYLVPSIPPGGYSGSAPEPIKCELDGKGRFCVRDDYGKLRRIHIHQNMQQQLEKRRTHRKKREDEEEEDEEARDRRIIKKVYQLREKNDNSNLFERDALWGMLTVPINSVESEHFLPNPSDDILFPYIELAEQMRWIVFGNNQLVGDQVRTVRPTVAPLSVSSGAPKAQRLQVWNEDGTPVETAEEGNLLENNLVVLDYDAESLFSFYSDSESAAELGDDVDDFDINETWLGGDFEAAEEQTVFSQPQLVHQLLTKQLAPRIFAQETTLRGSFSLDPFFRDLFEQMDENLDEFDVRSPRYSIPPAYIQSYKRKDERKRKKRSRETEEPAAEKEITERDETQIINAAETTSIQSQPQNPSSFASSPSINTFPVKSAAQQPTAPLYPQQTTPQQIWPQLRILQAPSSPSLLGQPASGSEIKFPQTQTKQTTHFAFNKTTRIPLVDSTPQTPPLLGIQGPSPHPALTAPIPNSVPTSISPLTPLPTTHPPFTHIPAQPSTHISTHPPPHTTPQLSTPLQITPPPSSHALTTIPIIPASTGTQTASPIPQLQSTPKVGTQSSSPVTQPLPTPKAGSQASSPVTPLPPDSPSKKSPPKRTDSTAQSNQKTPEQMSTSPSLKTGQPPAQSASSKANPKPTIFSVPSNFTPVTINTTGSVKGVVPGQEGGVQRSIKPLPLLLSTTGEQLTGIKPLPLVSAPKQTSSEKLTGGEKT